MNIGFLSLRASSIPAMWRGCGAGHLPAGAPSCHMLQPGSTGADVFCSLLPRLNAPAGDLFKSFPLSRMLQAARHLGGFAAGELCKVAQKGSALNNWSVSVSLLLLWGGIPEMLHRLVRPPVFSSTGCTSVHVHSRPSFVSDRNREICT